MFLWTDLEALIFDLDNVVPKEMIHSPEIHLKQNSEPLDFTWNQFMANFESPKLSFWQFFWFLNFDMDKNKPRKL